MLALGARTHAHDSDRGARDDRLETPVLEIPVTVSMDRRNKSDDDGVRGAPPTAPPFGWSSSPRRKKTTYTISATSSSILTEQKAIELSATP